VVVGAGESDQDMSFEGVATGASQPELAAWDSGLCEEAMDAHEPDASVDDSNFRLGIVDLFEVAAEMDGNGVSSPNVTTAYPKKIKIKETSRT
jgi:hypothetical protein